LNPNRVEQEEFAAHGTIEHDPNSKRNEECH
jgi:hypothetical protein